MTSAFELADARDEVERTHRAWVAACERLHRLEGAATYQRRMMAAARTTIERAEPEPYVPDPCEPYGPIGMHVAAREAHRVAITAGIRRMKEGLEAGMLADTWAPSHAGGDPVEPGGGSFGGAGASASWDAPASSVEPAGVIVVPAGVDPVSVFAVDAMGRAMHSTTLDAPSSTGGSTSE